MTADAQALLEDELERCLVTIDVQQTQLDRFREVIADMEEAFAEAYTSQSGRAIFAEWRDALHLVLAGQPPTLRARLAAAEAVVEAAREVRNAWMSPPIGHPEARRESTGWDRHGTFAALDAALAALDALTP